MTDTIPSALGNPGPAYRATLTVPIGPVRFTDREHSIHHTVAPGGQERRPRRQPPVRLAAARNILIVKLDFAGDWVLTTPLIDAVRAAAPHARITAMVLDRAFGLADGDPALDRVVSVVSAEGRRLVIGACRPAMLASFLADYRDRAFDLALVPRWDTDFNGATQLAHGSGARRVVGFAEASTPRRATANPGEDRFYTHLVTDRQSLHEAARQMTLLRATDRPALAEPPVRAHFTLGDEILAEQLLAALLPVGPRIAVAPFVDDPRRTLPERLLIPIVRRLAETFGASIAVLAAPVHESRARAFVRRLGVKQAASFAGRLSLRQSAAMISHCQVMIGMDSGPAHIAAGVGTPVAVFSCHPTGAPADHPQAPERFAPRTRAGDSLILRPSQGRDTCRDGCERDEPHCIEQLDVATVWEPLSRFVADALVGRPATESPP